MNNYICTIIEKLLNTPTHTRNVWARGEICLSTLTLKISLTRFKSYFSSVEPFLTFNLLLLKQFIDRFDCCHHLEFEFFFSLSLTRSLSLYCCLRVRNHRSQSSTFQCSVAHSCIKSTLQTHKSSHRTLNSLAICDSRLQTYVWVKLQSNAMWFIDFIVDRMNSIA